ncbi:DUF5667 domain-containing protein [Streptomyces lasiicapitis]|uniref:DUF5667 domain-containing protein n=1 Tax=Streptomyces lasiicapitis TaxID=1923961 RepID=A0ABQ2MX81_9ACTN|nr:DUF5667 domain-containing protein [Streptomyces lasiicapitis]GGO60011.1 hypothetical protein GCM10012286_82910 [Streptomyces lasiicapitis]
MIANVSAHRRANAFAQALEEHSDQDPAAEQPEDPAAPPAGARAESAPPGPAERDRMLALADGLARLPAPQLDPEVKVVQRAQLVAAMEAMLAEGTAAGEGTSPSVPEQRSRKGAKGSHRASPLRKLKPRTRLSKGIAAGGLTVGVAAGAFGGVAAASSDALPGDSLYGLKRGMEDLKLGMADSDTDRGQIYLDQASTRLNEARRLMERARSGHLDHESVGEVRRALSGMRHDAAEGHRLLLEAYERDGSLGPIQALSAFTQSHRGSWSALRDKLPVQLGDVGEQVSSVFDAMEQEVEPLRSLLPSQPGKSSSPDDRPRQDSSTGTHRDRPAPHTSGDTDDHRSPGGKPKPSSPGHKESREGLLPGVTDGILDPPSEHAPAPSGTTEDKKNHPTPKKPKPGKPEVTLPPLLPGLLPELGIEGEDQK